MSIARFHFICDHCGARGREYGSIWTCRECVEDVCSSCIIPDTAQPEVGRALCRKCAQIQLAEARYARGITSWLRKRGGDE